MATLQSNPLGDILRDLDARDHAKATVTTESRRYGKAVTVIAGLEGCLDLHDLLKDLKRRLANGGVVKESRLELQGDHRRRALAILADHGIEAAP